jgi:hypothetical protein
MMTSLPASGDRRSAPNRSLQLLLETVGWSPETLARKVNAALAQIPGQRRRIHEKTPYRWLSRGEVPHQPVPEVVMLLLTEATGEAVPFDQVWPRGTARALSLVPANHGLDVTWDHPGLLSLLEECSGMLTRRHFVAISGAALTGPAWEWLDRPVPTLSAVADGGDTVSAGVLAMVDDIVVRAQRLDDQQGGAARAFVAGQFACIARLLHRASYSPQAGSRLAVALAQLAQTAGFMAYEQRRDGEAQRWYLAGIRVAWAAGDRAVAASILGLMISQATESGSITDALHLAAAAQEAAVSAPAAVRALISARSGIAYAAAGDLSGFRRVREHSLAMIEEAGQQREQAPRWAGYVSPTELDAIAGRSLVTLARRIPSRQMTLLADAEALLRARALSTTGAYQRSALRHGALLGLAFTRSGDLDQAVIAGRRALERLPAVTSSRCTGLMRRLRNDLAPSAHRSPAVRELVADLGRQLPER